MIPAEAAALALRWLLPALALTAGVEIVTAALLGFRTPKDLSLVVLANLATNPVVNLLVTGAMALARARTLAHPAVLVTLVVLEALAVIAEWRIYCVALPHHRQRALRVTVTANVASFIAGLLVFGTGGPGV